ncbi:hypothetical protein BDZ97DRAFT_1762635 [Flammula alnicola]|nr:hypothetical protein BDZ97DRAFT_1762635 [Flammula alnicola]
MTEEPAPPAKKRGRPKKVPESEKSTSTLPPSDMSGPQPKAKRKAVEVALAVPADDTSPDDPSPPKKRSRKARETADKPSNTNKPEIQDLPTDKPNNKVPPGPKLKPAPKKSRKEIASERAAKKAAEEEIRLSEEALRKIELAQMHLAEERRDEEMEVERQGRLSAVMRNCRGAESSEGEVFEDVEDIWTESDEPIEQPKARKPSKRTKGMLRNEIDALTETLRGESDGGMKKNNAKTGTKAASGHDDSVPKQYANAGLRTKRQPELEDQHEHAEINVIGGLTEQDASAERPTGQGFAIGRRSVPKPIFPDGLQRNKDRKNELVDFIEDRKPQPRANKRAVSRTKTSENATQAQPLPVNSKGKVPATHTDNPDTRWTDDPRWTKVFLPTITNALYISSEPFKHFKPASLEFREKAQEIFDLSYPNVDYQLKDNDRVITEAYNRVKSKRSKIASDIATAVDNFFESRRDLQGSIHQVKEYARWAMRSDGPGFYATPTPLKCTVPQDDPDYIPPKGIFQSKFILVTATKYLRYIKGSVLETQIDVTRPPKGLFIMILASVERAFKAYWTGQKAPQKKFTDDNYDTIMKTYWRTLGKLRESQWQQILEAAGHGINEADDLSGNDSAAMDTISAQRGHFYIPSSPMKGVVE